MLVYIIEPVDELTVQLKFRLRAAALLGGQLGARDVLERSVV